MNELTENSKKYFVIVEELHSTPLASATITIGKESANNSFSAYQRKLKALGIIAQNYQENSAVTSGKLVTGKAEIETNDETGIDNIALYIKDNIDSIFGSAKNGETKVASVAMETKTGNLGLHSTKIGFQALTKGENAVAIGTGAQANAKDTISIGTGNIVTGQGSIAIGDPTIITGSRTSSLGNDNGTIASNESGIVGNDNILTGSSGIHVIGNKNTAGGKNALIFGNNAIVSADNGVAIGESSHSNTQRAIAIGNNAVSGNAVTGGTGSEVDTIAIGTNSQSLGNSGVAMGKGSTAFTKNSVAIGTGSIGGSTGLGSSAVAIGDGASAKGGNGIALGTGASANNIKNIAIGYQTETGSTQVVGGNTDIQNVSIGTKTGQRMSGQNNVFFGTEAGNKSSGNGNLAFGLRAGNKVNGHTNTAIGMDSGLNVTGLSNTAIGLNAGQNVTANGGGSNVAIGTNAGQNVTTTSSGGGDNIAIGTNAGRNVTSSIGHNTAVGHSAGQNIIGTNNVAFGSGSGQNVIGDNNTSMGINAGIGVKSSSNVSIGSDSGQNTDGVGNTAIGYQAGQKVNGGHNISMGYQSAKDLNGGSNAVIGFQAGIGVEGSNNIILGTNATSKSIIPGNLKVQNVVSLGTNSKATTDNSVSIGAYSEAKGRAAIAIGQNSNASKDNSMAIGNRTSVNAVKDVAIGSDSSTSATTGVSKATITVPGTGKSITYGTFAGSNPDAAFSVGSAGRERQIQNVAAGRISSTSTDAINGSQLYAVANELGKTWKANAGGNLSGSTTSTQVMPGDEVQFVAGKNLEVKQDLATGSQKYIYSLKKDVDLGSTGSLKAEPVTINNNGIDAGSKKITNVAPGTADTDAANVSQVKAAKTEVKSPDSSINVTTDNTSPDGHTIYNVTIDKSGKVATGDTKLVTGDTVNTAINNAKTDLINNNPLKFGGDSGTAVTRKLGEQLDIKGGATGATTSGNIAVIADRNNTLNIQLAKNLTGLDSITTNGGNTVINNNGITTPKVTINNAPTAGTDATNKDYVDSTKTKVTSNDSSVVVNKTTNGNQDVYDLSVDVTKLDTANKSLSNINNTGNSVISDIARKSINVVAGTNVKDIVKSDVQNSDGTTTTTYKINANGSKVIAGDGVMVATGVPGSDNITDYTVSVKNTTLSTTGTTVTAGDNNSYAKAGDVALAITKAATTAKTELQNGTNTNVTSHQGATGQAIYQVNADKSEVAVTGTGLSLDSKITTDSNGTKTTKYTLGLDTTQLTTTGGKVNTPTVPGKLVTAGDIATAINNAGWNVVAGNTGTGTTSGSVSNKLITPGEIVKLQAGDNLNVDQSGGTFTYSLKKDISLDSVTTGDTKVANSGITIGAGSNQVSLTNNGLNNGGNRITNVAAGTFNTDAVNYGQLKDSRTKVTSNDSSVVVNKSTNGDQNIYDLSVDTSKLDAANKSLSNINNDGNKVISDIARKSVNVVAGTNVKDVVKSDVLNSDGTTTTTYKINVNGAKVVAGDGIDVKVAAPDANNITDYTVSIKNTTLSTTGTTVTAGDNNSYAKAEDVALAITKAATVARTTVSSTDNSVTINKTMKSDGHFDYDLSLDTSKISSNVNLTYKANGGTSQTTTLANGLDFKDGDNTKVTVGANGEVKYSLNPTITGINSITTNGGGTIINNGGITTPTLTLTNSTPLISSAGGKVTVPTGNENQAVTAQTVANAINNSGWNVVAGNTGTGTTSGSVSNKLITPGEIVKLQAGDNLNVDQSGGTFTYSLKKDISLDSVTTGDTKVANSGITIGAGSNQVSLTNNGLNNGGNRIINVAAGTNKTDAVNVGQLNAAKTELENGTNTTVSNRIGANGQTIYKVNTDFSSIADAIGGNTKFEPTTGKIDTSSADIGGTGKNNVSNAVAAARTTVSSNDNSVTINKTTASDGHFNYDLKIDTSSISAGTNLAYKANGSNNQVTTLSNGLDFKNGDNTITTVGANGEVKYSVNPTMTGINSITTAGGGTTINNNGIEITGGPSVTSSGIDAGGKKVTNIAEGDISPTSNDAVTGRQVYNAISAGAADKATRAELAGVNNNLTAGIAGVAAMANLPQINNSASNRFNIAVAGGAYKNGRAMALGFSGVSDGGRFVYRASASLNNKRDVAVGLGVGYQFGKRDVMPNELDRMKSMVALIEEQKDSYSRQLKQQLEQESRKNQENSELIRQLMQEVQELKSKSNVSNRSNRS